MCTLRDAELAVCIASVLGLELGLVGPMQPPVEPFFVVSLCSSENGVIRLYRQWKVIHWLKAMSDERDKML